MIFRLKDRVRKLEARWILRALKLAEGNKAAAAQLIGIQRTTLTMKMKTLGLKLNHYTPVRDALIIGVENVSESGVIVGQWVAYDNGERRYRRIGESNGRPNDGREE